MRGWDEAVDGMQGQCPLRFRPDFLQRVPVGDRLASAIALTAGGHPRRWRIPGGARVASRRSSLRPLAALAIHSRLVRTYLRGAPRLTMLLIAICRPVLAVALWAAAPGQQGAQDLVAF